MKWNNQSPLNASFETSKCFEVSTAHHLQYLFVRYVLPPKVYGHGVYLYNVYMLTSSSFPRFSDLYFLGLFLLHSFYYFYRSSHIRIAAKSISMYVFISHAILDYLMAKNISFWNICCCLRVYMYIAFSLYIYSYRFRYTLFVCIFLPLVVYIYWYLIIVYVNISDRSL